MSKKTVKYVKPEIKITLLEPSDVLLASTDDMVDFNFDNLEGIQ